MAGGDGSTFGKFYLIKRIASGGMGEVFLAKLKGPVGGFEKLLVVKRILPHQLENREVVDMFFAEARVVAQLSHANIVQIYEMGEIEGAYFIAMEYVHGKSLRDLIDHARRNNERLEPAHVIEIIAKLCDGLSHAHNAMDMLGDRLNIIHRDVNPQNVLLSYAGEVKLIDFGIAKSATQEHQTETGTIKGKFVYMSPEQSAANPVDKRSDIFSVGICLYEALSSRNPFVRNHVVASIDAIHRGTPPPLANVASSLAVFDPVLTRALAKSADERYGDCQELRDALVALRADVAPPARSLAQTLSAVFAEQIAYERQVILDSGRLKTEDIAQMRQYAEEEHRSAADRQRSSSDRLRVQSTRESSASKRAPAPRPPASTDPSRITDRARSSDLLRAPHESARAAHSRLPFALALGIIILMSATAVAAVFKLVERRRLGLPVDSLASLWVPQGPRVLVEPVDSKVAAQPVLERREPRASDPAPTDEPKVVSADDDDRRKDVKKIGKGERVAALKPAPRPAPPPKIPPAAGEAGLGMLHISTAPPVAVFLNGAAVHRSAKVKSTSGKLAIGSGRSPETDPFAVTIAYQVEDGAITYTIDAEPWAIVLGRGGIGLGRTPVSQQATHGTSVLELKNPKDRLQLRVTLRYAP